MYPVCGINSTSGSCRSAAPVLLGKGGFFGYVGRLLVGRVGYGYGFGDFFHDRM